MSQTGQTIRCSRVDTHCHIDLQNGPARAVAEAERRCVHTVAVTNAPSVFFHTRDLCKDKRFVHAALGLHPELVASHGRELDQFNKHLPETQFIGEVGLDYVTTDISLRQRQRDIFESIVRRSDEAGGRVLTVHSRRAASDVVELLKQGKKNTAILHWFSGSRKELECGLTAGCYFSVNAGMLSSKSGQAIVSAIPRECVLTETDSPFARVGGQPASPLDVEAAIKSLAECWRLPIEEAAAIVENNFRSILNSHGIA